MTEGGDELANLIEDPDTGADTSAGGPSTFCDDLELCGEVRLRHAGAERARFNERSINLSAPCATKDVRDEEAVDSFESVDEVSGSLEVFWHRAGWLVVLLMCQSTSSLILQRFEFLIKSHPVVIYFLTMLVGAGSNAGGQSTVLVVRRLALAAARGDRQRLSVRRIVGHEVGVGLRLAVVLFLACIVRCVLFKVNRLECLTICLSMLVIVFTSTLIGSALPLLLSRLGVDPAHAGATIQVIMDVSGVLLTCAVSTIVLGVPLDGEQAAKQMGPWSASVNACPLLLVLLLLLLFVVVVVVIVVVLVVEACTFHLQRFAMYSSVSLCMDAPPVAVGCHSRRGPQMALECFCGDCPSCVCNLEATESRQRPTANEANNKCNNNNKQQQKTTKL
ncbi:unnamed protein product [Polarella glacialis]|uniref:SLC41A/MgtE integral membrane domain-containing protein n=1 Tax=Polarella glacialis TaxID=89957 RepID=A0A813LXD2_POLGL|nr:unnamed protein product [Polarella glacialis]